MPKAVFIDTETIGSANIRKITSKVGSALRREPTEYVGKPEEINLKGFSKLVSYNAIFWSNESYGIRPSHASMSKRVDPAPQAATVISAHPATKPQRLAGTSTPTPGSHLGEFTGWRGNSGRVRQESGQEFFCHKGSVAEGFEITEGDEVFFVITPTDKPLDMASYIIPLGSSHKGKVVNTFESNAFAEILGLEESGHDNVYIYINNENTIQVGSVGNFYLGKGFSSKKKKQTPRAEDFELST